MWTHRIELDPNVMLGKPVVKGTRIPVELVLRKLGEGASMDDLPARRLFVSAVTEAEVRTGIAVLPEGARRRVLADAAERTLSGLFTSRVLPFDTCAPALPGMMQNDGQLGIAPHEIGARPLRRPDHLHGMEAGQDLLPQDP